MHSSIVTISRPKQFADMFRKYNICVDDQERAIIARGQVVTLGVALGKHCIQAHIDWCSSNEVILDCAEPIDVALEVGCALQGWDWLRAMSRVTRAPGSYLYLKPVDAP